MYNTSQHLLLIKASIERVLIAVPIGIIGEDGGFFFVVPINDVIGIDAGIYFAINGDCFIFELGILAWTACTADIEYTVCEKVYLAWGIEIGAVVPVGGKGGVHDLGASGGHGFIQRFTSEQLFKNIVIAFILKTAAVISAIRVGKFTLIFGLVPDFIEDSDSAIDHFKQVLAGFAVCIIEFIAQIKQQHFLLIESYGVKM
nr:MAG TPA: hypothetical protein [Caudoviricetes sp.]